MSTPSTSHCPKCQSTIAAPGAPCPACLMQMAMCATEADTLVQHAPPPTLPVDEIAPHFPQLEIIECIGRGGMGVVYKARQKALNRLVALKLVAPDRETDALFSARFAREAQALAALSHPNIVTIYDFGEVDGLYYLLMEFVDGVNLRQAIKAGRFTPEQALAVVPPVCEALQYAHERGIVHRDIKPENLLLDKEGRVKIADFGIAKIMGRTLETEGATDSATSSAGVTITGGTPAYMAPEQVHSPALADHRADIYSLGVVLYELLTGELPKNTLDHAPQKIQVDVKLDEIVLRALQTAPELRYQTVGELRTQLQTVMLTRASEADAESPQPSPPQPAGRRKISWLAVLATLWLILGTEVVMEMLHHFESGWRSHRQNVSPWPASRWMTSNHVELLVPVLMLFLLPSSMLGTLALIRIRRSQGRMIGMVLALASSLAFPVFVVGAVIWFLVSAGFAGELNSAYVGMDGTVREWDVPTFWLASLLITTCPWLFGLPAWALLWSRLHPGGFRYQKLLSRALPALGISIGLVTAINAVQERNERIHRVHSSAVQGDKQDIVFVAMQRLAAGLKWNVSITVEPIDPRKADPMHWECHLSARDESTIAKMKEDSVGDSADSPGRGIVSVKVDWRGMEGRSSLKSFNRSWCLSQGVRAIVQRRLESPVGLTQYSLLNMHTGEMHGASPMLAQLVATPGSQLSSSLREELHRTGADLVMTLPFDGSVRCLTSFNRIVDLTRDHQWSELSDLNVFASALKGPPLDPEKTLHCPGLYGFITTNGKAGRLELLNAEQTNRGPVIQLRYQFLPIGYDR